MAISLSEGASNRWIYARVEENVRWALKCMIAHQSRLSFLLPSNQQANEAVEHGILWNDEHRECKRVVPHLKITQCRNRQAYDHIFKDCSPAPHCCLCAALLCMRLDASPNRLYP